MGKGKPYSRLILDHIFQFKYLYKGFSNTNMIMKLFVNHLLSYN